MFTIDGKNRVLNAIFGCETSALPGSLTVGLSTTEPTSTGENISEPESSAGYARAALVFAGASDGSITNAELIEFPAFVADAGVATHYVLFDENDVVFWFDALKASRTLEADTVLSFAKGAIKLTLEDSVVSE